MTTLINKNGNMDNGVKVKGKDNKVESTKEDFKLTDHYRPFLDVVAKSPYGAIEEHAKLVHQCVRTLHEMYMLYMDGNIKDAVELWTKVQDAEHEADKLKNSIRDRLKKSMFMPISRDQISRMLTLQDRIADAAEDVSDMMAARDTKIPEELKADFIEHINIVLDAVNNLIQAVDDVDKLVSSSFRKKDVMATQNKLHSVSELEWNADQVKRRLRRKIFEMEGRESPIAIYHMIKILRRADDIANAAETAESYLRMIIQK